MIETGYTCLLKQIIFLSYHILTTYFRILGLENLYERHTGLM